MMDFRTFLDITNYSATHVAHCLLYRPKSRPAIMAEKLGYKPTDFEFKQMRKLIAGIGDCESLFAFRKAS